MENVEATSRNVENVEGMFKNAGNEVSPMSGEELKRAIINYVKDYEKGVPPVKKIGQKFKITLKRFYTIFPGKMPELCRLAGKPLPVERMKRTEKAIKSKGQRTVEDERPNVIHLSEEQSKRLWGLSHLEKGKDPQLIIDELFDRDSTLRKTYNLSLSDTRLVAEFLKAAVDRGWSMSSSPNVVDFVTDLWNCGVSNLTLGTVKGLISILKDLEKRKWLAVDFVDYVTRHQNELLWYSQYMRGDISFEEFRGRIAPYVQG
ncbi:MAG: hypothetical protein V1850_02465 [Candidatus Bathyarchaeota archaeon]